MFDDPCKFVRRVVPLAKYLNVFTIEYRFYLDAEEFRRKVVKINRGIGRFIHSIGCRYLDMGKLVFTLNKNIDGVHFNDHDRNKFFANIVRVIKAVYNAE